MSELTPWGETYADLADAVLADKSAPPVLLIAAWLAKHRNEPTKLRSLVADAVALVASVPSGPAAGPTTSKETR